MFEGGKCFGFIGAGKTRKGARSSQSEEAESAQEGWFDFPSNADVVSTRNHEIIIAFVLQVILKEREEKKRLRLLEEGVSVDVTSDIGDVKESMSQEQEESLSQEGEYSAANTATSLRHARRVLHDVGCSIVNEKSLLLIFFENQ